MRRAARETGRFYTRLQTLQTRPLVVRSVVAWSHGSLSILSRSVPPSVGFRAFSTAPVSTATKAKKKDDNNIFFDNIGKIFLAAIAMIIGSLVRGSYNTSNKNKIRDEIEDTSALDPIEVYELRLANSELKPEVFRTIVGDLNDQFPQYSCSYHEFIKAVRTTMVNLKGGEFTIQLGHCMDRIVTKILDKYEKTADEPLPLALWLTTLSLALNSSAEDRINVLFEAMEKENSAVTILDVEDVVGYLQDTCQLPPDTQAVPTDTKFPTQQWELGTPRQLVPWEGSDQDQVDLEAFASILRSKSVCAWGECYHKKKS